MNTTTKEMSNISENSRLSTTDTALIALFAAIMAVCSWIMIPATVPFTMQTFGVFLAVGLLGGKRGTISIIVYLLLGAVGLPVFSGFTGGIGHILGPTGGYMVGFIFTALIMWLSERFFGKGTRALAISMVIGLIICYAFGTAWFMKLFFNLFAALINYRLYITYIPFPHQYLELVSATEDSISIRYYLKAFSVH